MTTAYVQFVDSTQEQIISVFSCEQDHEAYPNQGTIEDDDARYVAFMAPAISVAVTDPLEKLKAFLQDNPDVAAILK